MLVADGGFYASGAFTVAPALDGKQIAALFRQRVLKLLLSAGRISQDVIALMGRWRHTGIECILEPELSDGKFCKRWARLIRKVYEVDPLVCPRRAGSMRVIAFIEDETVIKKVLVHLGRWEVKRRLPPVAYGPPLWDEVETTPTADDPPSPEGYGETGYLTEPQYPAEAYF